LLWFFCGLSIFSEVIDDFLFFPLGPNKADITDNFILMHLLTIRCDILDPPRALFKDASDKSVIVASSHKELLLRHLITLLVVVLEDNTSVVN
jgi:hypothetical protein